MVRTIRVLAVNDTPELADGTPNPFSDIDEDGNLDLSRTELLSGFSDAESDINELTINNLAVSAGSISGNDSMAGPIPQLMTSTVRSRSPMR